MRDIKRLDKIYQTLLDCHKEFPDWRTGQLFMNFIRWHLYTYEYDSFYIEDDEFIKRFERFIKEMKGEDTNVK